jgi:hypothetical protein
MSPTVLPNKNAFMRHTKDPVSILGMLIMSSCISQVTNFHAAFYSLSLNTLHQPGTAVGDPIEANAAGEIFAIDRPVVFGTVKGNIGYAFQRLYFPIAS